MSNVPQESSFFLDKVWDIDIILYISGGCTGASTLRLNNF